MGILSNLTGWHAIIILAIIVLLFGATKLPALAQSLGQSMKIFKSEMKDAPAASTAPATPVVVSADAPTSEPVRDHATVADGR